VVDARQAREGREEDRIIATPTLVKKHPGPKVWFVGNLSNTEAVEEMTEPRLTAETGRPVVGHGPDIDR
jgi:hypothetical protein